MFAGWLLGGAGLLFVAIAAISGLRTRKFLSTAVAADGTVTGFEEQTSTDSDGDTTSSFHAVVTFSTAGGDSVKFTEKTQTFGGLSEGDVVPVKYDPTDPERARMVKGAVEWLTPIVLGSLGVALVDPRGDRVRRRRLSGVVSRRRGGGRR